MIKAIVFDFDGVIVNSEHIWLNSKLNTLKDLKLKLPKRNQLIKYNGYSSDFFFKKFIKKNFFLKNNSKIKYTYKKNLQKTKYLIPKLNTQIIKLIKLKGFKKFIVSNNSKNYIIKILKYHNIYDYFKSHNILALRSQKTQKPQPYIYFKLQKKFKKDEIAVIEDSDPGIKAALSANIKYVFKYQKNKNHKHNYKITVFKYSKTVINFINKIK